MIQAIQQYFNLGTRFYGLEVCHLGDAKHFFLLKIKKRKGELLIEEHQHFEDIQGVINAVETSIPVFLTVNTKGVLTKVARDSSQTGRALANTLFPNMDDESLYFESYSIQDQNVISIVRKNEVGEYLDTLKKAKISIFSISLGLSGLGKVVPYIQDEAVFTHSHTIKMDEATSNLALLKNEESISTSYSINGLSVLSEYILGFGTILKGLFGVREADTNLFESISKEKSAYKNKRSFKLTLQLGIGILLSILLTNFVFFSFYHEKVQGLREEAILNESGILRLKQLKEKVSSKELRLEKALSASNSKVSYYLDELALRVPSSILLEEISYQPLDKPIRPSKSIEYSYNLIIVSGMTSDNVGFTNWISELQRLDWIENVETMEYDFQNPTTSFFRLKIKIKDGREE